MNSIKLALLNKLERDVNEAKEIKTSVNGTDDIFIYFSGNRISLDHAVLEYARDYYKNKLDELEKAFEEA